MGHDITAYRTDISQAERSKLYDEIVGSVHGDQWMERYREYKSRVEVAYFRRNMSYYRQSMGDLLYQVLGDKAQAHNAGVSGDGGSEIFGIEELMLGIATCKRKLTQAYPGYSPEEEKEYIGDEVEFLEACVAYAKDAPERHVEISFS